MKYSREERIGLFILELENDIQGIWKLLKYKIKDEMRKTYNCL